MVESGQAGADRDLSRHRLYAQRPGGAALILFEKRGFGLFGQIVAILFAAVLLESAASIFLYERASQFSINGDKARRLAEHLVLSGKLIEEAPRSQRDTVASELTTTRYTLVWQDRLVNTPPVTTIGRAAVWERV